jgi:hypothetical protein
MVRTNAKVKLGHYHGTYEFDLILVHRNVKERFEWIV